MTKNTAKSSWTCEINLETLQLNLLQIKILTLQTDMCSQNITLLNEINILKNKKIRREIKNFKKTQKEQIKIERVRNFLKETTGIEMSHCKLKRYIEKDLRFSYKRGWSRPPKYSTQSIKQVKFLFWTEIIKMLDNQEILFSVDEACFNRNIKQHYSWLPIDKSWQIINDNFRRKVNLVFVMSNKSTWMVMIKNQTMNSICFWVFLKLLEKAVVSTMHVEYLDHLYLLVMWGPTHLSQQRNLLEH